MAMATVKQEEKNMDTDTERKNMATITSMERKDMGTITGRKATVMVQVKAMVTTTFSGEANISTITDLRAMSMSMTILIA
jgi:hypothetical protein